MSRCQCSEFTCARARECVIAGMRESGDERKGGRWPGRFVFLEYKYKEKSYV